MRSPTPTSIAPVVIALLALGGFVLLLTATRWGIGMSPDSVNYVKTARDLAATNFGEAVPGQFAPLYSLLLAVPGMTGLDPMDGARWLNALLFALNIALVAFIVRRTSDNRTRFWTIGPLVMLGSAPVLGVHLVALSEPVFLLSGIAGLYLLGLSLERSSVPLLTAAAVAVSLALLARYAGAAFVLTGTIAILLWSAAPLRRKVRDAFLFGGVSCLPMALWMAGNASGGSTAARELFVHPIGTSHVWQALYTVSGWLAIGPGAPDVLRIAVGAVLAVGVLSILSGRGLGGTPPTPVRVFALFVVLYAVFLVASISFFDANTPLDDRILLPAFVAGLILMLGQVDAAWPRLGSRRTLAFVTVAATGAWLAVHLAGGARIASASYKNGWGLANVAWRQSSTLARVRALPSGYTVYSNAPEIVYLHTGRLAQPIPKKWSLMNRQPNRGYGSQVAELRTRLRSEKSVVVYFTGLRDQQSVASAPEVEEMLSLRVLSREADSTIYVADAAL